MKSYIRPEIVVSRFNVEYISTNAVLDPAATPTISPLSAAATFGSGVTNAVNRANAAVQGNVNFQDAIKFR